MWNLKINDTNELTKQKETHRLGRQADTYQREKPGERERENLGVGD